MRIYCDIGNSAIKCFNQELNQVEIFRTNEVEDFSKFNLFTKVSKIIFASVVPSKTIFLKQFADAKNIVINEVDASQIKLESANEIDKSKMGIDILLNSWYCSEKSSAAIVVSFGTATVVSVIKEKTLAGYAIMPGLNLSIETLNQNTAKIKDQKFIFDTKVLGTNTASAISVGVLQSQIAYIKTLVKENPNAQLFITGGEADKIKSFFKDATFIEQMTLEALSHFFR